MSSFDDFEESLKRPVETDTPKQPIKILEPALKNFTKIAIPHILEKLHTHKINIEKYQRSGKWDKLNAEQIDASRALQQLKATMRDMDRTRQQIREEDVELFDRRVSPVRDEAFRAVAEFMEMYAEPVEPLADVEPVIIPHQTGKQGVPRTTSRELGREDIPPDVSMAQEQKQLPSIPQDQPALQSWGNLRENGTFYLPLAMEQVFHCGLPEDLVELNDLIHEFSTMVHDQGEKVDRIQDHVEQAHGNVQSGVKELGKAAKYKAAMFPVAGALIGGVLGGPIGLVAGMKIGAGAASEGAREAVEEGPGMLSRAHGRPPPPLSRRSHGTVCPLLARPGVFPVGFQLHRFLRGSEELGLMLPHLVVITIGPRLKEP
ncbi:endoplasmic reticulum-Golgi intermediate compartment organization [Branchiostoma belcheri]|nr:endoplasmic reticulum-Golgi intermediate compartment organization [Branchiostoma belcheri]